MSCHGVFGMGTDLNGPKWRLCRAPHLKDADCFGAAGGYY